MTPKTYSGAEDKKSDALTTAAGSGPTGSVVCKRCGERVSEPVGNGQCPGCGCFLPLNTMRLDHGASVAMRGSSAMSMARRRTVEAAILGDLGGEDVVSEVIRQLVVDFAAAVELRDLALAHVAAVGPFTKSGKRRAVVDLYLQTSQRVERLAARIGTSRRRRPIPSIREYLETRQGASR